MGVNHRERRGAAIALAFCLIFASNCATIAPGQDPIVVQTERVLKAAPAVYDAGMSFAEQNKATIPVGTLKVFEVIRVNFPPAYRGLDSALQTYKAAKGDPTAVLQARDEVQRFVDQILALVRANGGPDLTPAGG